MRHARIFAAALALLSVVATAAFATEYVLSSGVALPEGGRAEMVSMIGARHALPGGLLGEASVARVSAAGGTCLSTLAYARGRGGLRAGAGVLALRAPDQAGPARPATISTAGFQLACGLQLPVDNGFGIDVDARYVFLDRPEGQPAPDKFATRYWSFTVGIAILGEESARRR